MTSLYLIGSPSRPVPRLTAVLLLGTVAATLALATGGCGGKNAKSPSATLVTGVKLLPLQDQGTAAPSQGIQLAGAGNEWVSFTVQVTGLPAGTPRDRLAVAVAPLSSSSVAAASSVSGAEVEAYQLIDMPVDAGRADHVRHVGQAAGETHLPRALLPLPAAEGRIGLAGLRPGTFTAAAAGTQPVGTQPATTQPVPAAKLWVDVRVPKAAAAGKYASSVQVVQKVDGAKGKPATWRPVASVPVELTVHGFALPEVRSLKMVGQVTWESLARHYEGDFEAISPHLLVRGDAKYAPTLRTLDALMAAAQRHRASILYPRLQPVVKWPALINNAPPDVWWDGFDSVVGPWLGGQAFADGVGVGYWQVPEPDELQRLDPQSRLAYWNRAASHFDQQNWLAVSPVALRKLTAGRPNPTDAIELSAEAAQLLATHSRVGVGVPLEDDQVQVAIGDRVADAGRTAVDPLHARRLRTAAPGLIAGRHDWPKDVDEPRRWLRTDLPGLAPTGGTDGASSAAIGRTEQDVRLWAWLAFLRRADQLVFGQALPARREPAASADPAELAWFYPGHWFGQADPVPTVQLKWLRSAEQDYEYLTLARQRGWAINALWMARLLAKPVQVGLGQTPDPAYALMTGTADARVWADARRLLVKAIELTSGAVAGGTDAEQAARDALDVEVLQWTRPQERPLLIGRSTTWSWAGQPDGSARIRLALGLDVYNASDVEHGQNQLRWASLPVGWEVKPQPIAVPKLETYRVFRTGLSADFNLNRLSPAAREPAEVDLTIDSPTAKLVTQLKLALPIASSDRREGRFAFDGRLDDWTPVDRVHDGPLVRMLTRPAVLAQSLEPASTTSQVYTNWTPDNLYVAFAVNGVAKADGGAASFKNFVEYQARRAWGEDLCEVLVQPVYKDNSLGPVLHVVVKPNGSNWVERKLDPKLNADPWEPFESTGTRYAAQVAGDQWTGELAVPWRVMADPKLGMPTLLRFNFSQHRPAAGESASWAGPVDFGRDDALTGLLHLKLPIPGAAGDAVRGDGGPTVPGTIER